MKRSKFLKHLVAAVLIAAGSLAQAASPMEDDAAEARQLYDEGRWTLAWERFASLADRGDVDSARMVIRMTRFGPQLFQQTWTPTQDRMAKWHVVASGQPVRTAASN